VEFREFVLARTPALLRFAYLLTGDAHLAEDLVQEALVRAHRHWTGITHRGGPEPYVRKAVLRQFLSWRRRRSSGELPVTVLPDRIAPQEPIERVAETDEMWNLLRALPHAQRAVLVLRYYEDLPDTEIARMIGCSSATVRVHAFHALHRLRAVLGTSRNAPSGAPKG
jgi:RNA polymerase sigma-70 factor (sigma-E family)